MFLLHTFLNKDKICNGSMSHCDFKVKFTKTGLKNEDIFFWILFNVENFSKMFNYEPLKVIREMMINILLLYEIKT